MKGLILSGCGLALAIMPAARAATPASTYVLESSALRLEVSATYSYTLIEMSTGNVLLSQNLTTFTIGNTSQTASSISGVTIGGGMLDGTLKIGNNNTAHVNFSFTSPDILQVTLTPGNVTPTAIAERFADTSAQRYYGVWENALPTSLDNRGVSAGYDGKEPLGTTTKDVFAASARAPFYLTNRNYGIYAPTQSQGTYTFGVSGNTSFKFNSATLQYDILHGATPKDVIARHNAVAGPAFMPPDWAFSTIFWRDDFHQLPTGIPSITNAQQLVLDDAAKLAQNRIHAGAMWIDRPYGTGSPNQDSNVAGWGNMDFDGSFPNPSQMVQSLDAGGIRLMLWAANKANNGLKTEGSANGYLFTGYSASPAIDFRNPAAYSWFNGKLNVLDSQALLADGTSGISGFKLDRGGEGEMPDAAINSETTLFQKLAFENMQARQGNDFFNFTRNINDQGRRYAAVWSGDPKTTWTGFQTSIKNGLRSGLINFPMWGSDTGGYSGSTPTQELFSRWVAFAAWSPMMEVIQGPGRNIFYDYSAQTVAILKKYTDLHHDLIPYTRSSLAAALQTGVPVMRPMFVEFPNDAAVADTWDQYMYGPNLLVAPVTTAGAASRSVYLPALPDGGKWLDYNGRKTVLSGGQMITASAAIDVLPTYVREGAIVPRGDIVRANDTWSGSWSPSLRIEVFPSARFASSFAYYTGSGMETITASPLNGGWEIVSGDPLLSGTFDIYLTEPTSVLINGVLLVGGQDYTYDQQAGLLRVPFASGGSLDLDIFGAQSLFGGGLAGTVLASNVPEPATSLLLGLGVWSFMMRRRLRKPGCRRVDEG